jgi:anti-sigma regulatory factor (Ser/Thr protein kinase)
MHLHREGGMRGADGNPSRPVPEWGAMNETVRRNRFPLTLQAPRRAREWVRGVLPLEPDCEEVVLLMLSELVANSVRHSGRASEGDVDIIVRNADHTVRIEVRDPGPGSGVEPTPSPDHSGLRIVESLADRWGVTYDPTNVWFEVATGAA